MAAAPPLVLRVHHKVDDADGPVLGYLVEAQTAHQLVSLLVREQHGLVDPVEQGLGDDDGRD